MGYKVFRSGVVLAGSVHSGGGGRRTHARPGQVSQGLRFPPPHHQPWTRAGSGPAHSVLSLARNNNRVVTR